MKKVLFLSLLTFFCLACNNEIEWELPENRAKIDLLKIGFKLGGEISVSESDLKSFNEENTDLFALQFYDIDNKPYARVVGDDISKIMVDFKLGQQYKIKMTYLRDGMNLIRKTGDKTWGSPFNATFSETEINKVYYTSSTALDYISSPFIDTQDEQSDVRLGKYVEIDRYHEVVEVFEATEEISTININLKRLVFGVKLNVELEDRDVEVVRFSFNHHNHQQVYFISMSEGKGHLEIPFLSFGFPNIYGNELDYGVVDNYNENVHISIGSLENEISFFDGTINVPRNVMMVMTLRSAQGGGNSQNSFEFVLEEGEMEEEEVNLPADN